MASPTLVLVPPTPVRSHPSGSSRTSGSSVSALTADRERSSTDTTTIVSIYSMYDGTDVEPGGEQRDRWSRQSSIPGKDMLSDGKVSKRVSDVSYNNSFYGSSRPPSTELAYFDALSGSRPSSRYVDAAESLQSSNGTARVSVNGHPRPVSENVAQYSHKGPDSVPAVNGTSRRHSAVPPTGSLDAETHRRPLPERPPRSRPPSAYPLPPSAPSSPPNGTPTILAPNPASASRARSSPRPTSTTPPLSSTHLQPPTPATPQSIAFESKKSAASQVSLVQSENEDVDAFHVRSTYARLEMFGVKGDGYEEGIERTRARTGVSRASELRAYENMDDGSEKSRELSPQEVQTLASLDRYGFFAVPSHDRLIRLSAAPLSKRLAKVSVGPSKAPAHATALSALPTPALPPKESARIAKWTRMLVPRARDPGANVQAWDVKRSKEPKLRARTYKGVPDRWRAAAWALFMDRFGDARKLDLERLGAEYREALELPSSYDVQIDLDVPRTISGHIMFRTRYGHGQRSLFHVLHSFSLRCSSCGYVQGMGPIAATLLCYMDPERVYAALVRLHDAYALHALFSPGFPGLLEAIFVQERITEALLPDVYAAFRKHMISTTSYATKWYITLFANSVPFQTQLRLWDVFLLEGQDVFVGVAVAIVWVYRDHITSASANFETVLSLLSSFFVPEDEDALLSWIGKMLGDKKLRGDMNRWRTQWHEMVATGKDADALL